MREQLLLLATRRPVLPPGNVKCMCVACTANEQLTGGPRGAKLTHPHTLWAVVCLLENSFSQPVN